MRLQRYDCVDNLLATVTSELLVWLNQVSEQNEKYSHKIKVANYSYFAAQVQRMQEQVPLLESFSSYARQQVEEAEVKYVNWMVAYEFPALSALATRMDGVGSRVNEEELSLYIRRRDVINVVKELDQRHVESSISALWKRLLKHFKSEYDAVSAQYHSLHAFAFDLNQLCAVFISMMLCYLRCRSCI